MIVNLEAEYDVDFETVVSRFPGDFQELSEQDYEQDEILRMLVARYGIDEVFEGIPADYWSLRIV